MVDTENPEDDSIFVLDRAYDLNFKERWLFVHKHMAKKISNTFLKPRPFEDLHYELNKVISK